VSKCYFRYLFCLCLFHMGWAHDMATFQCRGLLAETISLKIDRVISSCVVSLGSHIPVFVCCKNSWTGRRDNWGLLMLSQEDLLGRRSYWILARDRTGLAHDPCVDFLWSHCVIQCHRRLVRMRRLHLSWFIICFDVVKWQSTGVCNGTVW
jgi:hypothetical protein